MNKILKWLMKPKYIVKVLLKYQDTYYVQSTRVYKTAKRFIKAVKGKIHIINVENPHHIEDNKRYYYVDSESNQQIVFQKTEFETNPEIIHKVIGGKTIEKMIHSVRDNVKQKIFYLIIGLIAGVLLGAIIMSEFKNAKIEELYEKLANNTPVVFDYVKLWFMMR